MEAEAEEREGSSKKILSLPRSQLRSPRSFESAGRSHRHIKKHFSSRKHGEKIWKCDKCAKRGTLFSRIGSRIRRLVELDSIAVTAEPSSQGGGDRKVQFVWKTRTIICIGVTRGLAFLHEEVCPHIVHRDIKASNILLDKDLTPKISDFCLAKSLPSKMSHISTRVARTIGYLAPEYVILGQLTRKADIYSFGVLLLEIVTGKANANTKLSYEDQFLVEKVWALHEKGELESVLDTSLASDSNAMETYKFLSIGLLCTQDSPKLRLQCPC